MNVKEFSDAVGELDLKYVNEALYYSAPAGRRRRFHRLPAAFAAALLALLLMGAGFVAAVYGDSIQDWFGHYWEAITGQQMSTGQAALIDHLSQDIGISRTVGVVTITADSATVGDDTFYVLLKIDGINFSDKHSYDFLTGSMETTPNLLENGAFVGWGTDYLGVDGDGSALLLLNYEYLIDDGFVQDPTPLQVDLRLGTLACDAHTDKETIITEGEWNFSFVIDRSELPEIILLPDTEVMAMDSTRQEEIPVKLTEIEQTSTGLRFRFAYREGELSLSDQRIAIVLNNGKMIDNNGGIGSPTEDNRNMCFSYQWLVPVNLDEAAVVQIGETRIPIPSRPDKKAGDSRGNSHSEDPAAQ